MKEMIKNNFGIYLMEKKLRVSLEFIINLDFVCDTLRTFYLIDSNTITLVKTEQ